jgi:glycosyltransferase involved in cell wall biosynthesis
MSSSSVDMVAESAMQGSLMRTGGEDIRPVHVALDARVLQESLLSSRNVGLGGRGRYAHCLLEAMRVYDDLEFTLLVDYGPIPGRLADLVASAERFRLSRAGLAGWLPRRLAYARAAPLVSRLEAPLLNRRLRIIEPSVTHVIDQPPPLLRVHPRIVTLHDLGPIAGSAFDAGPSLLGSLARSNLTTVRSADVIVCDSWATRNDAVRLLGVAPDRLEVVYPGVDTQRFSPGTADGVGQELGLPRHARYFLHVGVLHQRKNPERLLHALRLLAGSFEDLHLVCVGPYHTSPDATTRVSALAAQLGIEARVHLAGDLTDETLVKAYRGSLGLVFPSLYEGFGFPVVEALACGVPVVAADNSSLPEVGGDLAILVNARDHGAIAAGMARLLDDEQLSARVRAGGPAWARQFSWRATADHIHDLYMELAAKNRSPGRR